MHKMADGMRNNVHGTVAAESKYGYPSRLKLQPLLASRLRLDDVLHDLSLANEESTEDP